MSLFDELRYPDESRKQYDEEAKIDEILRRYVNTKTFREFAEFISGYMLEVEEAGYDLQYAKEQMLQKIEWEMQV